MSHLKKLFLCCLLLALCLSVSARAEQVTGAIIQFEDTADADALVEAISQIEGVTVGCRYDLLLSGVAVKATDDALEAIEALPGVLQAAETRTYQLSSEDSSAYEQALAAATALSDQGYNGDGIVIAVLDSGFRITHNAFAENGLSQSPALTQEDIESFVAQGGTPGQYLSERIPFAYDYFDEDDDVTTSTTHGTHVAALALGRAVNSSGEVVFQGGAPAAQLLAMKVFSDSASSTNDAVILKALEDAYALGADVINLSLGTDNGFTSDNAVDGLYSQAFSRLSDAGIILCCAAGNSGASVEKPTGDYTDYGTLCAPATYLGSTAVAAGGTTSAILDASAWGATSDLRLVPMLTAPGEDVLSASADGDRRYEKLSGTSMASATAAGELAVLLQNLRNQGVTDRREAAQLALALAESTAQILTNDGGVSLSPRQQGAGLLDVNAALETAAVVTEPLLELGDSAQGQFTLRFTVRNLGHRTLELQVDTTALTDAFSKANGNYYSALSPRDITRYVAVEAPESVTVPGGEEVKVTVKLTVDKAFRQHMAEVFPNGFFVEGYVRLTGTRGTDIHATFLGYCGSWSAAPIVDQDGANTWENVAYLSGGNEGDAQALAQGDYAAIPTGENDALYTAGTGFTVDLYTLRNAQHLIMLVSNADTGEIYYVDDTAYLPRATVNTLLMDVQNTGRFSWDGTGPDGTALPGGTEVTVSFFGWLESDKTIAETYLSSGSDADRPSTYRWLLGGRYDRYLEWTFSLTVDRSAPTVKLGADSVAVRDDQYLSYICLRAQDGTVLAEETYADGKTGLSHVLDLSGVTGKVYLTAQDYASNAVGYEIDLETGTVERCATAMLTDVTPSAWYHEAVDLVYPQGYLTDSEGLTLSPEDGATRGEVLAELYKLAGSPEVDGDWSDLLPFTDIRFETRYRAVLAWAYHEGLATGYSERVFGVYAVISRQQLAVLLCRFAQLQGEDVTDVETDLSVFSDGDRISAWAEDSVAWAVANGYLTGRDDGTLSPRTGVSRAELAQVLARYLEGQEG